VVYIIENNEYAMGTSVERSSSTTELYRRGSAFGIPGEQVDGMSIHAVREAGLRAVEFVREGNGPYILEMKTYRYRGHSMSDPAKYRTKEEVEEKKTQDPLFSIKHIILKNSYATEEELKEIEKSVKTKIAEVAEFATNAPLPSVDELYTDIFK
jgi:pyruvate dehydrogenase E1 component alpha subunit